MFPRATTLAYGVAVALVGTACTTDSPVPSVTTPLRSVAGSSTKQFHNKPKWSPPLYKEPIQGVKVGNRCTFPTYEEVSNRHPSLVATVGEYDEETCAGLMYFGEWRKYLEADEERMRKQMRDKGVKADTISLIGPANKRDTESVGGSPQAMGGGGFPEACNWVGQAGTVSYRKVTKIDIFGVVWANNLPYDSLFMHARVEFNGRMYDHAPDGSWCGDEVEVNAIRERRVGGDWTYTTSPADELHQDPALLNHQGASNTQTTIGSAWALNLGFKRTCGIWPFETTQVIQLSNSPYMRVTVTHPYYNGGPGNGTPPANTYECSTPSNSLTVYTYQPSYLG